MATKREYLCNTIERREYFLPGGSDICKIVYDYPYVICEVRHITKGATESYVADKRHPQWEKHVQLFETLAWARYKLIALRELNRQKSGSFK